MPAAPEKLHALRDLLARRFPAAGLLGPQRCLASGVVDIDRVSGGFPIGALTEIACLAPSSGGLLILARVLELCRAQQLRVALLDGSDRFDPQSFSNDALTHLVWVRCRELKHAMSAADLLTRDANFGLVVLDVCHRAERELRREPSTSWYRLQRAVEQNGIPLLVITPCELVPSALLRFVLRRPFSLAETDLPRATLIETLPLELRRQRRQIEQEAG